LIYLGKSHNKPSSALPL